MLARLYDKVLIWAKHRYAPYYLALMSFTEASVFPIPPDFMLAPMVLAKPERAWTLALMTTFFSVLGGILGYLIGYYFFELIGMQIIDMLNLHDQYALVVHLFKEWGVALLLLASFTPIPYKLFTITAGVSMMPLLPFIAASWVGRMARFFMVAGCLKYFGPTFEKHLLKSIDRWGWGLVGLVIMIFGVMKFL